MHIGLDFDNTIVCYDKVFAYIAKKNYHIPEEIPLNKTAIKNFLKSQGNEYIWTDMQGYVYSIGIQQAEPYPGLLYFLYKAKKLNWQISIISHKTKYSYAEKKYDLHYYANLWIETILKQEQTEIINNHDIFFENSQEEKIKRISNVGCNVYVDDLPEIFLSSSFPKNVQKILFDPEKNNKKMSDILLLHRWDDFYSTLEDVKVGI